MGIIGALIKKNNSGIMGLKFEKGKSPIKVQSLNERPHADELGYNGRARLHGHIGQCMGTASCRIVLTLNLRAIAAAHAAAVHRLLRLLVCLIAYSINIHTYFIGSCMRTFQKENNYYKNNRGSFWELENRIMGRKKE